MHNFYATISAGLNSELFFFSERFSGLWKGQEQHSASKVYTIISREESS